MKIIIGLLEGRPLSSVTALGRGLIIVMLAVLLAGCSCPEKPLTRAEQRQVYEARVIANAMFGFRDREETLRTWHHDQLEKLYRLYIKQSESGASWWSSYDRGRMNKMHLKTGTVKKYKLLKSWVSDDILAPDNRMQGTWVILTHHVTGYN